MQHSPSTLCPSSYTHLSVLVLQPVRKCDTVTKHALAVQLEQCDAIEDLRGTRLEVQSPFV